MGAPWVPISASGPSHPERRVTALAVLFAMVGAALLLTSSNSGEAVVPSPTWLLPVIVMGFMGAELSIFRFIFRRESLAFSLSEIPLALSLVYLAPGPAVAA